VRALVLGIRGVLVPERSFQLAAIEAAARSLSGAGVDPRRFGAAARQRLNENGPKAIISRTLNDLKLRPGVERVRRACLEAAAAVPPLHPDADLRGALSFLASAVRLAFLDRGPAPALEALIARLELADVAERRLWTEQLGHDAAAPRGLAFRWLARRLELRPRQMLYVTADDAMQRAAESAGCKSLRTPAAAAGSLEWLIERLEWGERHAAAAAPR
jgi:hypothetical protein